jgi:hypothetical protein
MLERSPIVDRVVHRSCFPPLRGPSFSNQTPGNDFGVRSHPAARFEKDEGVGYRRMDFSVATTASSSSSQSVGATNDERWARVTQGEKQIDPDEDGIRTGSGGSDKPPPRWVPPDGPSFILPRGHFRRCSPRRQGRSGSMRTPDCRTTCRREKGHDVEGKNSRASPRARVRERNVVGNNKRVAFRLDPWRVTLTRRRGRRPSPCRERHVPLPRRAQYRQDDGRRRI